MTLWSSFEDSTLKSISNISDNATISFPLNKGKRSFDILKYSLGFMKTFFLSMCFYSYLYEKGNKTVATQATNLKKRE